MKYFTSDGLYTRDNKGKEEQNMDHIIKKQGVAITFLTLALTLALVIGAWLYTDFAYGDDGDGTTTNTEAVNNDNGDGGENTPAPAQSNDTNNDQTVQVQPSGDSGNDVQSVETPPVDQDADQQTGDQGTPQLRGPAKNNPEPTIKYVSTDMYFATSFGSAQGSIASLDRTASGGEIPLDRAFLVASAWVPEWGHDINPDNPKEAMEFTGEIIDEFGHTFYEGDAISTNEAIRLLTEAGVSSTYATYKLYAQYVTRIVPDVAKVIGIDGVDSGSFTEEYTGDWTYKMWFYGNRNERYVGDFTLPEPGEVDGYTFLYWDRNGDEYYPGDQLTLSSYDFDENGCLYFTAVWEDADGNIVTELPEKPEEPDTPDGPEVIDPTDDDVDNDAEVENVDAETAEDNEEATTDKDKAEATTENVESDSPATGDGYPLLGWTIIFILALSGILGGVFRKKN